MLFSFPQHFAQGLRNDAGKVAAEASDIGPDALKASFNLIQPPLKPILICASSLSIRASSAAIRPSISSIFWPVEMAWQPQQRYILLKLGQQLDHTRIVAVLLFRGLFQRGNAAGEVGDLSFNVHAQRPELVWL